MNYKLPDGPRAARLNEISATPSLDGEIRLARLLAEESAAAREGSAMGLQATAIVGRLVERSQVAEIARGALLPRAAVVAVGRAMAQAVLARCGGLIGFDQVAPLLLQDFERIVRAERLVSDEKRRALPDESNKNQE